MPMTKLYCLQDNAAIFLEEINIAGNTMIALNHGEHKGGSVYLHDVLAAYKSEDTDNSRLRDKIAEALKYIHEGKTQNAIMVLNHAL
jgi:hypothetical protein